MEENDENNKNSNEEEEVEWGKRNKKLRSKVHPRIRHPD